MSQAAPRSGVGYDSHRLVAGGPLILGGVQIPADVHLEAHSDGDAICHAITDAILGALGNDDIGTLFPDTDPENAGRDSIQMLALVVARVKQSGWRIGNVDVTVIAQQIRISPHRQSMRSRLAAVLDVEPDQVSIKGKTNEGMGWVGRGEGIACIAVATMLHEG